jgi:hypothetical protein
VKRLTQSHYSILLTRTTLISQHKKTEGKAHVALRIGNNLFIECGSKDFKLIWLGLKSDPLPTVQNVNIRMLINTAGPLRNKLRFICTESNIPDPDSHIFRPPISGSISQRYGFGSFYHQAK